jgi:3-dehydroquinate synthase
MMAAMGADTAIVEVNLPGRAYSINIGAGTIGQLGSSLRSLSAARRAAIITDSNVGPLYGQALADSLAAAGFDLVTLTVPAGELSKSLQQAERLYDRLADRRAGRGDPIIALGGGVVGDLAGFVAATWLRGVPLVQCPTTLEADIDAGVGGKTAVNHPCGKNLIGAFHQPMLVCIDVDCLRTLSDRDYRAALAESVKHALIAGEEFFHWHEDHAEAVLRRDPEILRELIRRNCQIKASVVIEDEREAATRTIGRAALNLGHTIGHALEAQFEYSLRHGEAVSLGLIAALDLAVRHTGFSEVNRRRTEALLGLLELPIRCPAALDVPDLLSRITLDKKNRHQALRFVSLQRIGAPRWLDEPDEASIQQAIDRIATP